MTGWLHAEHRAGRPLTTGAYTLIPFSKSWQFRIPGLPGGFIWNHPSSILVQNQDGVEENLPIPDLTRNVILTLIGFCIGATILMWVLSRNQRSRLKEQ